MRRFLIGLCAGLFLICAAAPPCAAAKTGSLFYSFQVAAFSTAQEAQVKVKALRGKGFEAFYVKALVSGKVWYRVCMGQYPTPKQAQRDAELLKKRGVVKEYQLRRVQPHRLNRRAHGRPSLKRQRGRKKWERYRLRSHRRRKTDGKSWSRKHPFHPTKVRRTT
ncbi:MAG: SPOR domain-containing protein [Deltaproteobacteria bacterium]|nr:SPOR domain-containing protein [Deltaproteobacteria bacterium]